MPMSDEELAKLKKELEDVYHANSIQNNRIDDKTFINIVSANEKGESSYTNNVSTVSGVVSQLKPASTTVTKIIEAPELKSLDGLINLKDVPGYLGILADTFGNAFINTKEIESEANAYLGESHETVENTKAAGDWLKTAASVISDPIYDLGIVVGLINEDMGNVIKSNSTLTKLAATLINLNAANGGLNFDETKINEYASKQYLVEKEEEAQKNKTTENTEMDSQAKMALSSITSIIGPSISAVLSNMNSGKEVQILGESESASDANLGTVLTNGMIDTLNSVKTLGAAVVSSISSVATNIVSSTPKIASTVLSKVTKNASNNSGTRTASQKIEEITKNTTIGSVTSSIQEMAKAAAEEETKTGKRNPLEGLTSLDYLLAIDSIGKFAVGTPYIPNDMIALVHEGEMIVPKSQNPYAGANKIKAAINANSADKTATASNRVNNVTYTFNSPKALGMSDVLREMRLAEQRKVLLGV